MAVSFHTPVAGTETIGVISFTLTGLTARQPVVIFVPEGTVTPPTVTTTFATSYTWRVMRNGLGASVIIGTGGSGGSGSVFVHVGGSTTGAHGIAVGCIGASSRPGAAAVDFTAAKKATTGTNSGHQDATSSSLTPSQAGDGALYAIFSLSTATISTSPSSPWTNTAFTGSGTKHASLALRTTVPTTGGATSVTWVLSAASQFVSIAVLIKEAAVPQPPTGVSAVAGDAEATVSFTAPATNGGAAVTDYTVTASPGGVTKTANATSITVTGLTNGVAYTFTVKATNSVGNSTASAPSSAVTPGTVPNAPTITLAGSANAAARLTWQAPATDGGAPIRGYYIFKGTTPGGESTTPVIPLFAGTSFTVGGLTNGTTYYFTVKAVNVWGQSVASNEVSVTPSVGLDPTTLTLPSLVAEPVTRFGAPAVALTVTNNQVPVAGVATTMLLTVLRSDGTYALGASPSTPLNLGSGDSATTYDATASYGVSASYVALLSYGGATSAPSPVAKAVMGQAPDTVTLYGRMGWPQTEDTSGELEAWLSGIGQMVQAIDSLATDGYDTEGNKAPGWSQVLDIDRCPTAMLPWLAQFLGVRLNSNLRDDQQRFAIENPQGFGRGTPAAIVAAVDVYLQPGYTATLVERDTGPYHLAIEIPTAGIAGLSTCESLWLEYATCSALAAAFATCSTLWQIPEEITVAVEGAIPAGLGYSLTYV